MPELTDSTHKSRILIADDDATMRLLMRESLGDSPYIIEEVDNGLDAIESVRKNEPDMVLLDVRMPGLSGFEVCTAIRKMTGDINVKLRVVFQHLPVA